MYPEQCTFAIHRPPALAMGRSRGKRGGGELCSLSSFSFLLLSLLPVLYPARIPLPAIPAKWQSREMLCSRDLSWSESGKKGPIYFKRGMGSRCHRQQCASASEDSWRTNSIFSLLSCPFFPLTIAGQMSSRALEVTKRKAYIFTFFQPSVILKVKWYCNRVFLVSIWQNI